MSNSQSENTMKHVTPEEGQSANIIAENIERLRELLPDAFTENGVNFETLRQLLGDAKVLDEGEEKYGLNWYGKKKARQIALTPSTGTLLPCPEESVDWDTTKNLLIEGDNLEVLKLLQKSYANKIKLIYIDPPYNTGEEFIYPDNYQESIDTYLKYSGQIDDNGMKFSSRTEIFGRKHTNWLNMIYPRLKLAKNLLSWDGVIAISIDDNELPQLCAICDEIFGEVNRKVIAVKMSEASGLKMGAVKKNGTIPKLKEYLVLIKKNGVRDIFLEPIPKATWDTEYNIFIEGMDKTHKEFIDQIQRAEQITDEMINQLDELSSNWEAKSVAEKIKEVGVSNDEKEAWLKENAYRICQATTSASVLKIANEKRKSCDAPLFFVPSAKREIAYFVKATYSSESSKPRLQLIFAEDNLAIHPGDIWTDIKTTGLDGEGYVSFKNGKKPLRLLDRVISACVSNGDYVMDFFAGSGTSGEAVMRNAIKRMINLNFILVQLPEPLDPNNTEQEESFTFCKSHNLKPLVSELTRYRLTAASQDLKSLNNAHLDAIFGFKKFKLTSSNIRLWSPDHTDLESTLLSHEEHLIGKRTEQDVLYELLLKRGVDLTTPIERREVAGKNLYSIGYGALFACLDESISRHLVEDIAQALISWYKELKPCSETHAFFRDSAFSDDVSKTNMVAILEQNGISHVRSL